MRISDWSSDVCSSDLEDVERSGDLGRIAWAAHTVMTPKERAALNDRGRRRLGRAIAIVARDHIDNTVPSTEAHHAALWAERNKANMTISEMHSFWIDDCEPSKKNINEWKKDKKRFVEIFGDVKHTGVTRPHEIGRAHV